MRHSSEETLKNNTITNELIWSEINDKEFERSALVIPDDNIDGISKYKLKNIPEDRNIIKIDLPGFGMSKRLDGIKNFEDINKSLNIIREKKYFDSIYCQGIGCQFAINFANKNQNIELNEFVPTTFSNEKYSFLKTIIGVNRLVDPIIYATYQDNLLNFFNRYSKSKDFNMFSRVKGTSNSINWFIKGFAKKQELEKGITLHILNDKVMY